MNAIVWNGEELGAKFDTVEIPEDLKEKAQEYHDKLIELVVELDDQVCERVCVCWVCVVLGVCCAGGVLCWGCYVGGLLGVC